MKFGVIGTGVVGQTLAHKLWELNHDVMVGTRDVTATLGRTEPGIYGTPPFAVWKEQHPSIQLGTFAQAADHGEMLINATAGSTSLNALHMIGSERLGDKILLDVVQPVDVPDPQEVQQGILPPLSVVNTDSLGEQIQRTFPRLRVVKALNHVSLQLMGNPRLLADGDHHVFVCGNDAEAKARVTQLLTAGFGWKHVIDLGDISAARGTEAFLLIWRRIFGTLQTPLFNFKIVQG